MTLFADIESPLIRLLDSDIDTDQIYPARFLRTAAASGLADCLFYDRRSAPDFPLHPDRYRGEGILLAGPNFGCGSSREHAPWALRDFGIRAIISTSFADIFFNNCLKNGLLPIVVDAVTWLDLTHTQEPVRVSLGESTVESEYGTVAFKLDPFARYCLLNGLSELDFILQNEAAIEQFEVTFHNRIPPLHEGLRS